MASKSVPLRTLDSPRPYLPPSIAWRGALRQRPRGDRASQHNRPDGQTDVKVGRRGACSELANHAAPEPGSRETVVLRRPDKLRSLGGPRPCDARGSAERPLLFFVRGEANGLTALPRVLISPTRARPFPDPQSHREDFRKHSWVLIFRPTPSPSGTRAK